VHVDSVRVDQLLHQGTRASRTSKLTHSEQQVADRVATGMRNADVARALHLSVGTVETHLAYACRKLGVTNRAQQTSSLDRKQ
jgi:DNA-binding NarL/FixJ family response regulator